MAKKKKPINQQEAQRRKLQSMVANPQKYQKACLKNGCCKNCQRNVIRHVKSLDASTQTVFGNYFSQFTDNISPAQTVMTKKNVCAATSQNIVNEWHRCSMWTPRTGQQLEEAFEDEILEEIPEALVSDVLVKDSEDTVPTQKTQIKEKATTRTPKTSTKVSSKSKISNSRINNRKSQ